jgi:hypothetical protein
MFHPIWGGKKGKQGQEVTQRKSHEYMYMCVFHFFYFETSFSHAATCSASCPPDGGGQAATFCKHELTAPLTPEGRCVLIVRFITKH